MDPKPFNAGSWVAQRFVKRPDFGTIKEIYNDGQQWFIDIFLYDLQGKRLLPAQTARLAKDYREIVRPEFPVGQVGKPDDYYHLLT